MAMSKKEQAEFAALQKEVRVAKAFRFTEAVSPDLAPPKGGGALSQGFLFNTYNGSVSDACSSAVHHSHGRNDKATTQQPRWLFSTRTLALKALRHEMERDFAAKLAAVDAEIEAEAQKQKGESNG